MQTPRGGTCCDFDIGTTITEAATAAALTLGYRMSDFTLAKGDEVLDRGALVGDVLRTEGVYDLVETGSGV